MYISQLSPRPKKDPRQHTDSSLVVAAQNLVLTGKKSNFKNDKKTSSGFALSKWMVCDVTLYSAPNWKPVNIIVCDAIKQHMADDQSVVDEIMNERYWRLECRRTVNSIHPLAVLTDESAKIHEEIYRNFYKRPKRNILRFQFQKWYEGLKVKKAKSVRISKLKLLRSSVFTYLDLSTGSVILDRPVYWTLPVSWHAWHMLNRGAGGFCKQQTRLLTSLFLESGYLRIYEETAAD